MSSDAASVAAWLAAHPAPIHRSDAPSWTARVLAELGDGALKDLVNLLAHGDLEQQYQSVAAARALGAEVWARGDHPNLTWRVALPGEGSARTIRPERQLRQ